MVLRGTKQGLFLLGVSLLKSDTWSYMGLSKVCSFWGVLAQGGYVRTWSYMELSKVFSHLGFLAKEGYMVLHGTKQGLFLLGCPCSRGIHGLTWD